MTKDDDGLGLKQLHVVVIITLLLSKFNSYV